MIAQKEMLANQSTALVELNNTIQVQAVKIEDLQSNINDQAAFIAGLNSTFSKIRGEDLEDFQMHEHNSVSYPIPPCPLSIL